MSDLGSLAAIGLGGNIGNVVLSMQDALAKFDQHAKIELLDVSSLYQTPPWGNIDQPPFMNACALLKTTLKPEELLQLCLHVEREFGRERLEKWGPRTIDLDVLFYDEQKISTPSLTVPHPRMTERAFVLVPLAEICPDKVISGKTVSQWSDAIDKDGITVADNNIYWQKDLGNLSLVGE